MTTERQQEFSQLKQYFSVRVVNESRRIVDIWQNAQQMTWTQADALAMREAAERLARFAQRFMQHSHVAMAEQLLQILERVNAQQGRLTTATIEQLDELLQKIAQTRLQCETGGPGKVSARLPKPLYIALADESRAQQLAEHLMFYGMASEVFTDADALSLAFKQRYPITLIMDVDFVALGRGLEVAQYLQQIGSKLTPVLFYSAREAGPEVRLAAVRAGGEGFLVSDIDASSVVEKIETFATVKHQEPFRVFLVDDSRAQSMLIERILNQATLMTQVSNDPIAALNQLDDFNPDLIILDMYMPECSGPELATMIRQCERYVSVPIIYLSGEEDLDKQLHAMRQGAEDFLTKPVQPHHLVTTVRNRVQRARNLKSYMVRDSLTGLYNHTHFLQLLESASQRSQRTGLSLCLVMLDIDHFKRVNDNFGHPVGDKVIKSLALLLKQRLRNTDYIGRYGGEEFAVAMWDTDAVCAAKVINELRVRFEKMTYPGVSQSLRCTFSAGVAQWTGEPDVMQLVTRADEALYSAKGQGRNQVVIAEPKS